VFHHKRRGSGNPRFPEKIEKKEEGFGDSEGKVP
jgi:hypothetical protein